MPQSSLGSAVGASTQTTQELPRSGGGKSINKAGLHPASLTPRLFPLQETRLNCIRIARKGKLPAFCKIPAPAA